MPHLVRMKPETKLFLQPAPDGLEDGVFSVFAVKTEMICVDQHPVALLNAAASQS
jgi:hypothetical protein